MARSVFRFFPKTSVGLNRTKPKAKAKISRSVSGAISRSISRQTQLNGQCFEGFDVHVLAYCDI